MLLFSQQYRTVLKVGNKENITAYNILKVLCREWQQSVRKIVKMYSVEI